MKELYSWKGDDNGKDKHMDFNEAFRPMFILIGLSFVKLILFKNTSDIYIAIIGISGIVFARLIETYFDRDENNDARLWLVAIPLTTIFIC